MLKTTDAELFKEAALCTPRDAQYKRQIADGHSCNFSVVYCDSEKDVIRCTLCGKESIKACNFDENYD